LQQFGCPQGPATEGNETKKRLQVESHIIPSNNTSLVWNLMEMDFSQTQAGGAHHCPSLHMSVSALTDHAEFEVQTLVDGKSPIQMTPSEEIALAQLREHKPVVVDTVSATHVLVGEPYVEDLPDELTPVCVDSIEATGMGFTETDVVGLTDLCFAKTKSVEMAPAVLNITVSQKETGVIVGGAEETDWTVMDLEGGRMEPLDETTTWTELFAMTEETDLGEGSVEKGPAWTLVHLPQVQSFKEPQRQVLSASLAQRLELFLQTLGTCSCFPTKATT